MSEQKDDIKKPNTEAIDEETLEKLAVEELMREAVQGAARAEVVGPSGWVKAPKQKTNKRFLANTIRNAVASNKYNSSKKHQHSHKRSSKHDRHPEPTITKDRSRRK